MCGIYLDIDSEIVVRLPIFRTPAEMPAYKRHLGTNQTPTALVIDRDADVHRRLHVLLGKRFDVHHAYFPKLALSLLQKKKFRLIVASFDVKDASHSAQLKEVIARFSHEDGTHVVNLHSEEEWRGEDRPSEMRHEKPTGRESFYEQLRRVLEDGDLNWDAFAGPGI